MDLEIALHFSTYPKRKATESKVLDSNGIVKVEIDNLKAVRDLDVVLVIPESLAPDYGYLKLNNEL